VCVWLFWAPASVGELLHIGIPLFKLRVELVLKRMVIYVH
jgi:hypothetical protein